MDRGRGTGSKSTPSGIASPIRSTSASSTLRMRVLATFGKGREPIAGTALRVLRTIGSRPLSAANPQLRSDKALSDYCRILRQDCTLSWQAEDLPCSVFLGRLHLGLWTSGKAMGLPACRDSGVDSTADLAVSLVPAPNRRTVGHDVR